MTMTVKMAVCGTDLSRSPRAVWGSPGWRGRCHPQGGLGVTPPVAAGAEGSLVPSRDRGDMGGDREGPPGVSRGDPSRGWGGCG